MTMLLHLLADRRGRIDFMMEIFVVENGRHRIEKITVILNRGRRCWVYYG
jgi:hypothetical protein